MEIVKFSKNKDWQKILQRPSHPTVSLEKKVEAIIRAVRIKGDRAVQRYSETFDGVGLKKFLVGKKEFQEAEKLVAPDLKQAIAMAKANIEKFHAAQGCPPEVVETMPGIRCWRKSVAIEKVGLYIPGGSAPLFSTLLMLGCPARIAGCGRIIVCSPPNRQGKLHPAILYTAGLLGLQEVYKIGGAQAIAAMAFGTATVPAVHKIFGPGNQFITAAKQSVQKAGIAIDLPAGPSEVAIYADESANASFVAADLLSQAEHGPDSQVVLVTSSLKLSAAVRRAISAQLEKLPRKEIAKKALGQSKTVLVNNEAEAFIVLNAYAPEHLLLNCSHALRVSEKIINAGSVFIGNYSPESAGDYASGTNHTLPTNGYARAYSGVSVDSFVKKITFQQISREGLSAIGAAIETMAEAEGLRAHAEAVRLRLLSSNH